MPIIKEALGTGVFMNIGLLVLILGTIHGHYTNQTASFWVSAGGAGLLAILLTVHRIIALRDDVKKNKER